MTTECGGILVIFSTRIPSMGLNRSAFVNAPEATIASYLATLIR